MRYTEPRIVDQTHIDNQRPAMEQSSVRICVICKKTRSLAQFWNVKKLPVFKFCKTCRGE
jgi:hypothetical protein